jgi:DNA processing protein
MGPPNASSPAGGRELSAGSDGFPSELGAIPEPPAHLWLRGRLPPAPRVALVGARRADGYGLDWARRLAAELTAAGVAVVSGGAAGVDTAALQGCLDAGGRPVAVLGTGLDVAYPVANRSLFERVAERGALVGEYPPGTPGRRAHFPQRNRLISGLAEAVVVVRAARRSGSLLTARWAERQGRRVLAVPGPAGDPLSAGCHELLRRGAGWAECGRDILSGIGLVAARQTRLDLTERAPAAAEQPAPPAAPAADPAALGPEARRLYESLSPHAASVDALAERCGLPAAQVAGLLLELELDGLVEQRPGMLYQRRFGQDRGSPTRRAGDNQIGGLENP